MADPETPPPPPEIPLQEAVARDLIPCAMCGARGADVKQVEGKPHFLCARCSGSAQRTKMLLVILGAVALAAAGRILLRPPPEEITQELPGGAMEEGDPWALETRALMGQRRYVEAMDRVATRLKSEPAHPGVVGLMGQCLWHLGRHEESIPHFRKASE